MRNLTIKRNKAFVGCLGKTQVWMRDEANCEMTINFVPCRMLGELKNGEEKTFVIPEDEVRLMVISDKATKDFAYASRVIPAGKEDVRLSGRSTANPQKGNPFDFDQ